MLLEHSVKTLSAQASAANEIAINAILSKELLQDSMS